MNACGLCYGSGQSDISPPQARHQLISGTANPTRRPLPHTGGSRRRLHRGVNKTGSGERKMNGAGGKYMYFIAFLVEVTPISTSWQGDSLPSQGWERGPEGKRCSRAQLLGLGCKKRSVPLSLWKAKSTNPHRRRYSPIKGVGEKKRGRKY